MFIKNFARLNEGAPSAAPVNAAPAATAAAPVSRSAGIKAATDAFLKPTMDAEESNAFGYDFSEFEGGENAQDPTAGDSGESSKDANEPTVTTENPSQFSPYSFKGSVLGESVEQTFATQKELDSCIQRGLAAPKIYNDLQKLRESSKALQADSDHVNQLYDMAKNTPKEFLELVFDELIEESAAADWVYDKFQHFSSVAKMSPAEREHQKKLKDAERIIEEQRALRRQQQILAEQEAKQGIENDRKYVSNWRTGTIEALKKEIPSMYHNNVKEAMDLVILQARAAVDANPQLSVAKACMAAEKKLKALLEPYKRTSSPEAQKKALGDALADKSKQATQKLQGMASGKATSGEKGPQKTQKERTKDVFKEVQWRLSKGASLRT